MAIVPNPTTIWSRALRLKKLVLQGFKSFKDKTSVYFDCGVTGIVGPNGCGKSNIVDALFWVMGEQSAKHLRGKSMKDLIFAGSSKYGPGGFAEVVLVLENITEKHIHIGKKVVAPREIQISRKLYRSGDSEYRINGLPARLRDIQEIFMDTGAGAKSYSVIAQGEIDRLVQAKPEERRTMIEEVAGITKFKWRKRESLRKIEQTNLNLNRLKDLQTEIHKNLKSLERQAERAEKARSLKQKVAKGELVVNSHCEFDLLKSFVDYNNFIRGKKLEIAEWEIHKQALEVNLEQERLQKIQLMEEIELEQKTFNEESRGLAGSEEKLNYLTRTQTDTASHVEMRVRENTALLEETKQGEIRREELREQLQFLQASGKEGASLGKLQSQAQELEERLQLKELTLGELRGELGQDQEAFFNSQQELFRMDIRASELARKLKEMTAEMEEVEQQSSGISGEMAKDRIQVNISKEYLHELERKLQHLVSQTDKLAVKKANAQKELDLLTKELLGVESKLDSLRSISQHHQDQNEGVREFLKSFDQGALLGSLVKCKPEYLPALQSALASRANSIVWDGPGEQCEQFLQWSEKKQLNVKFLAYSQGEFGDIHGMKPLWEVAEIRDERYLRVRELLRGIYVSDCVEWDGHWLQQLKNYNFSVIVAKDGRRIVESLGNSLRMTNLGKGVEEGGRIFNNDLIEKLQQAREGLQTRKGSKRQVWDELSQTWEAMTAESESLREMVTQGRVAYASLRSALDTKLATASTGNMRTETLSKGKQEVSGERLKILEDRDQLQGQQTKLSEVIAKKDATIATMAQEVKQWRKQYTELKNSLLVRQTEAATFDQQVQSCEQQRVDLEQRLTRNLEKLQENDRLIKKYDQALKDMAMTVEQLQQHNADCASQLRVREVKLGGVKDQLSGLSIAMDEREDEVKKLVSNINRDEKEIVEKAARRDQVIVDEEQVVRNIFEKHYVDLRAELAKSMGLEPGDLQGLANIDEMYQMDALDEQSGEIERVPISPVPYEFHRYYGQNLREQKTRLKENSQALNRIGEINWQAIGDYERQKARYRFLKQQEEELKNSVYDLEQAIGKIDEKSRQRFKHAFREVNARFEQVFPIIFGGGSAQLKLLGSMDDPECGIDIMAWPPDKKMQNVNLMSGGEKALTAVALIFSIFLVKPSPFCLLDEVDAPLDDANVGRFNELLREMSNQSQFILITHNKRTMEFNNTLYGITMQEPGISTAVSVQLQ